MEANTFLAKHQIFTTKEIRAALKMAKNKSTLPNLLSYHLKKGHIIRIRKGLYYSVPRGEKAKTHPVDPYLVASRMTPDAILGYHTALAFHGNLHSLRNDFVYITQKETPPTLVFRNMHFKGVIAPKKDLGVENIDYLGCKIRMTTLERTFVDVLDKPSLTGSWEEIWRSLESIKYLNFEQVVAYAKILDNATTYARIAFFLHQHREMFNLTEKDLSVFDALKPKSPHYMDRHSKKPKQLIAKWNLIVPKSLIQRSWEEPHENI